jgi:hypothetical protein
MGKFPLHPTLLHQGGGETKVFYPQGGVKAKVFHPEEVKLKPFITRAEVKAR